MNSTTTPTIPVLREPVERSGALSRWSFRASLLSFVVAAVYIVAIVIFHLTKLPPPEWAFTARRIIPAVDLILAAAGVSLNLAETLRILARSQEFDPNETGKEIALDDVANILKRMRPGCFVRVTVPLAMVGAMAALLLGLLPLPGYDGLRVHPENPLQSCTGSLVPFTFELDNSESTIDVSWLAAPVESINGGTSWAEVQPSRGTLKPGQRKQVAVIPNVLVCRFVAQGSRLAASGQTIGHVYAAAAALHGEVSATYHVQVTIQGHTTRTTTVAMSLTDRIAAPTPPPTPIPPHASLVVSQNLNFSEHCNGDTAPTPYTVTLNNSGSNVAVGWQFAPNNGSGIPYPWANASPPSGTLEAGQMVQFTISPLLGPSCPPVNGTFLMHASLQLSFPQGGSQANIALTDNVTGPAPYANLQVTSPSNWQYYGEQCDIFSPPESSYTPSYNITLDNTGSNVSVSWRFVPQQYQGTTPWATASPPNGTLNPGQTISVTIQPDTWLCPGTGHATLQLGFPSGGSQGSIDLYDIMTP